MKKIMVKDSSTVCPVNAAEIAGLGAGSKIKINGQLFTVKGGTAYQLYVNEGQTLHVLLNGACKSAPKEVEFEVVK